MKKRIFDLLLSCVMILAFFPIFAVVSLIIFLTMGRPIFFIQERVGLNGAIFNIFKFRTMESVMINSCPRKTEAARVTPLGRVMRVTGLDELPQLFNILNGDMSFVGPRPLLVEYLEYYSPRQMSRHLVRPGITGIAQVYGRNQLSWNRKFALDIWYVQNTTLRLDICLLGLTFVKLILGRKSMVSGSHPAEKFSRKH